MQRLMSLALATVIGVAGYAVPEVAEASRYARVAPNKLTTAQRAPLRAMVDISFPRGTVTTVGQAVNVALAGSGYQLAQPDYQAHTLFQLPLPEVHRQFTQIELAALLVALGQPGYELLVDDVNRLVSYRRYTGSPKE